MGAVKKLYDDNPDYSYESRRMKIPLQSEVAKYMREKMGWPEVFCNHYAERFWNYYQAQGWKLSNGNSMKDWKAAFCSQWQVIKAKEDIELLAKQQQSEVKKSTPEERLNQILAEYKAGTYQPQKDKVCAIYDYLKGKGLMKLPKDVITRIVEACGNDRDFGKMLSVKALFDIYLTEGKRF